MRARILSRSDVQFEMLAKGSVARLRFANDFPRRSHGPAVLRFFGEGQDLFVREMAAGADGLGRGQVCVGLDPGLSDVVAGAQVGDQGFGRGDLAGRRGLLSRSPTRQMPMPYSSTS